MESFKRFLFLLVLVATVTGKIVNPVVWNDLADPDIIRVGDAYYYSASNMHYVPGAPLLRSYDLVNWEYIGHSVPRYDFGPEYDLDNGKRAYIQGTWASFLKYRESDSLFYWGGCIRGGDTTYIYRASNPEGPWERHSSIPHCYYDAGLLVDDDDELYIAYGNTQVSGSISVAHISKDASDEIESRPVFDSPESIGTLEGSRFYKREGLYYIFVVKPGDAQYILKSSAGPWGPYEVRNVIDEVEAPANTEGALSPHQGGLVQTQHGDWYYLAFVDAYPGGRIPILAPVTWTEDGWPEVELVDGRWGDTYPGPLPARSTPPLTGSDTFEDLGPRWEWNHNPDNDRWSVGEGLIMQTSSIVDDFYQARNTLTQRILGPASNGTFELDISLMKDGDRAGMALVRQNTTRLEIQRHGDAFELVRYDNATIDPGKSWITSNKGIEVQRAVLSDTKLWLRALADIRPNDLSTSGTGRWFYSIDGESFSEVGLAPFVMERDWRHFMGYRFAVFNYATESLGGEIKVNRFDLDLVYGNL